MSRKTIAILRAILAQDAGPERIGRDAFLYMDPPKAGNPNAFAQCEACRVFVPAGGKLDHDGCIPHGSDVKVGERWSCGLFNVWPDGKPHEDVVKEHRAELIAGLAPAMTPAESGLVDREVRCINCFHVDANAGTCKLYERLNADLPALFDLDPRIELLACCNAQTARPEAPVMAGDKAIMALDPLEEGSSKATVSRNIAELVRAGHPVNQAAAIAYKKAGEDCERLTEDELAELAHDCMAHDRMLMALDRSTRHVDADGRLHVAVNHISKATVNPYYGREIPEGERLGLDPSKVYYLLRDPDELRRAAPTFNNIPLLSEHVPVTVDDHQPDLVVGSTGTDADFADPYLDNSLVIWEAGAIAGVNTRAKTELSCAYRYVADMTPGTYKGLRYDGVMRNIVGNHVALVEQGRAGSDVIVGDAKMKPEALTSRKALMVRGAIAAIVKPLLAADAEIDFNAMVKGVTVDTYDSKAVAAAVAAGTKGKLKSGASLAPLAIALDAMEDEEDEGAEDDEIDGEEDDNKAKGEEGGEGGESGGGDKKAKDRKRARDKKRAKDNEPEPKPAGDTEPSQMPGVQLDKKGMDAALDARDERWRAIRAAERDVRPVIGELADPPKSAAGVYKLALDHMGVDTKDVPEAAFPALFKAVRERSNEPALPTIAADAASGAETLAALGIGRVRQLG